MAGQGFLFKSFNFVNGWIISTNRINMVPLQSSVRTLKMSTKERLKTLNIPEKPKKPATSYLHFVSDRYKSLLQENPDLKLVQVVKKLAQEWKEVSEEQKLKYKNQFQKELEAYDKEKLKYDMSLTEEQKEALLAASLEKKENKKKRKLSKLIKENNKPKKPLSPYLLYLKEQSQTRNIPFHILITSVKDEWAKVSEPEKERFKNQYLKEIEIYNVELKKWEKKMLDKGHVELVRHKTMLEEKFTNAEVLDHSIKKPSKK